MGRGGSSVVGQPVRTHHERINWHDPFTHSTRLLDACITQPLPEDGQLPMEAPLVSACTFYILYEASTVPSFIFTLANLWRSH